MFERFLALAETGSVHDFVAREAAEVAAWARDAEDAAELVP